MIRARAVDDGFLTKADNWFDRTLDHFRASGVQLGLAHALSQKAIIRRAYGESDTAVALFEEANVLLDALGDTERAALNELQIAVALAQRGHVEQALMRARRSEATLTEMGVNALSAISIQAAVLLDNGDHAGALDALRSGVRVLGTERTVGVQFFCVTIARFAVEAGAVEDAARLAGFAGVLEGVSLGSLTELTRTQTTEQLDSVLPDWRDTASEWAKKSVADMVPLVNSALDHLESSLP